MADNVKVNLERARWWVHGTEGAGRFTSYGPGEVEIPRAMAEGLVRAGQLPADVIGGGASGPTNKPPVEPENGPVTLVEIAATDAAAKLAEEEGIDLATVRGTGADGRITKGDVEAARGSD